MSDDGESLAHQVKLRCVPHDGIIAHVFNLNEVTQETRPHGTWFAKPSKSTSHISTSSTWTDDIYLPTFFNSATRYRFYPRISRADKRTTGAGLEDEPAKNGLIIGWKVNGDHGTSPGRPIITDDR